jgi:hypothetical protein
MKVLMVDGETSGHAVIAEILTQRDGHLFFASSNIRNTS